MGGIRAGALVLGLLPWSACYQGIDSDRDGGESAPAAADTGSSDGSGDGSGGDDDGEGPADAACGEDGFANPALRYLTKLEYDNTVRDLFGEPVDVSSAFPPDEAVGGYFANSARAPSQTQLEMFLDAAETLAVRAAGDQLASFVDCQPSESGCAEAFIAEFGRGAFRRPLTADEAEAYLSDFDAIAADQSAARALEVVSASMLISPNFLYIGQRTELDDATAEAYDLASRLSYAVWATMPDEALFEAAASGELATDEGLETQVRRMLQDGRAADMLATFTTQWVEVNDLPENSAKHPDLFPEWTPELAAAAEAETAALLHRAMTEGGGTLSSVLLGRDAYVDADLAALYGVAAPAGGSDWVVLPEGERGGLLTRAAFLAGHAHVAENSWVHRGKVVRERLLCGKLPPPPPVADDSPINDDSRLNDPQCAGCHTLMDPIGVGFESYDPIGRHRGGAAPGEVVGLAEPGFDGAVELSRLLAESEEVEACFARQMYQFAHRRDVEEADECTVEAVAEHFAETDGDLAELIVSVVSTNAFRGER